MKATKTLMTIMMSVFLCCVCLFSGCSKNDKTTQTHFGEFGYNGIYLTSFASQNIEADRAKQILSTNMSSETNSVNALSIFSEIDASTEQSVVNFITNRYAGFEITTKYYPEGSTNQISTSVTIRGENFKTIIEKNEYSPYSKIFTKYLICFPELIDKMEECNKEFQDSAESQSAPFKNIFTYHTNNKGELVVHTRSFEEIASSIVGGISSDYQQDTEILYDNQNKIQKWQSSFGLTIANPTGDIQQGYILEVEFNWIIKIE